MTKISRETLGYLLDVAEDVLSGRSPLHQFENVVDELASHAYDEGHEAGYDEGYDDGVADSEDDY